MVSGVNFVGEIVLLVTTLLLLKLLKSGEWNVFTFVFELCCDC